MTSKTSSDDVFEYIGKGQFVSTKVVSVQFHPSVIEVDYEAFKDCRQLKELVLNERLQKIGGFAFYNCQSLESITLPSTVTEIGDEAFRDCYNLREVVMKEGLQKIGRFSFHACSLLQSITLPSTLTDIGDHAFDNCTSLREVVIMNEKIRIGNNAFSDCMGLASLCYKFPNLSSRVEALFRLGYTDIVNKIISLSGVHWRGSDITIPAYSMLLEMRKLRHSWVAIKSKLDMIVELIACYEKKEATALLELAFWEANMNQVDDHPIHREAYRIEVPGPVMVTIMQYLHVEKEPVLSSAASIFPRLGPLFR